MKVICDRCAATFHPSSAMRQRTHRWCEVLSQPPSAQSFSERWGRYPDPTTRISGTVHSPRGIVKMTTGVVGKASND